MSDLTVTNDILQARLREADTDRTRTIRELTDERKYSDLSTLHTQILNTAFSHMGEVKTARIRLDIFTVTDKRLVTDFY